MSLHQSAKDSLNLDTMLEISTKSESTLGKSLSAFNLTFDNGFFVSTVEAIYQGSKKFIGEVHLQTYINMILYEQKI